VRGNFAERTFENAIGLSKPADFALLETKGFDEVAEIKAAAAARWVAAVNADARFGSWRFAMARSVGAVREFLDTLSAPASTI
jgi:hypothetical protein